MSCNDPWPEIDRWNGRRAKENQSWQTSVASDAENPRGLEANKFDGINRRWPCSGGKNWPTEKICLHSAKTSRLAEKTNRMISGNQIRAARALIDCDQQSLAKAAGIAIATLVSLEKSGAAPVTGLARTLQFVVAALEAKGVTITGNGVGLAS
jgi:DNA-binding XRE family transcriptional regulator